MGEDIKIYDIHDRRTAKIKANEHSPDRRYSSGISVETLEVLLNYNQREQEKLWDQLERRDENKISLLKMSFGIFSLFLTGMLTAVSFGEASKELFNSPEFNTLLVIVVGGMGLINFVLIKYIVMFKYSRLLFTRQINCLRNSMDSCIFSMIEGRPPENTEELFKDKNKEQKDQNKYYRIFGKHRKMPIENIEFRRFHKKIFESADDVAITVISLLTVSMTAIPVVYLWGKYNSNIVGAIGTAYIFIFLILTYIFRRSSKKTIEHALETGMHEP